MRKSINITSSHLTPSPVTIITPLVRAALSLYQSTYGNGITTFVDVHLEKAKSRYFLKINSERRFRKLFMWRIELLLILIPTWSVCVYQLLCILLESRVPLIPKPTQQLNLIQVICLGFNLATSTTYLKIWWIIHRNPEIIPAINYCLNQKLENLLPFISEGELRILQGFSSSFHKHLTDITLLGLVFGVVFLAIPVPALASLEELDPYRPFMTRFILSHPYFHTIDEIIWSKIVSTGLMCLAYFNYFQIFTIVVFLLLF